MARYRKRPVVVEAVQWFKEGDHPAVKMVCVHDWLNPKKECCGRLWGEHGEIATLEGTLEVCPGDWVITGIKGEHYPCKPDIFELTYEEVGP